jgi:hypothetical protein
MFNRNNQRLVIGCKTVEAGRPKDYRRFLLIGWAETPGKDADREEPAGYTYLGRQQLVGLKEMSKYIQGTQSALTSDVEA